MVLSVVLGSCSAPERTQLLDEKAQDIYRSLMCPICPGQTIEQSQNELSAQMRALIREKLEQGQSKGEILQFFVERYGETILAAPGKSGFSLIAWLAPVTVIISGGIVIWLAIRKWVKGEKESFPEPVTSLPDSTYDEEYRRQLEKELKVFDKKGYR